MSSSRIIIVIKIIIIQLSLNYASDVNPFDDSVLYSFKWPGKVLLDSVAEENIVKMTTKDLESYSCVLPDVNIKKDDVNVPYEGGNGLELLGPLFAHTSCAYRLDSYWTYEICHGKHVKQYHEERETKIIITQEFYLGRWDKLKAEEISKELTAKEKDPNYKIPAKKIEGITLPYVQVNYTDGTSCDLNGMPRQTTTLYMCYEAGKHDFYSIKEIATCHYEIIIFTNLLCGHPKYKPINTIEHEIKCVGLIGASNKPKSLQKKEALVLKREIENLSERITQRLQATMTLESLTKDFKADGEIGRVELNPSQPKSHKPGFTSLVTSMPDKVPTLKQFLSGEHCITGNNGAKYWKYEFCYGRYVEQFHIEEDKSKSTVRLGNFNYETHKAWFTRNMQRAKKSNSVIHFYSDGAECGKTNRSVEVVFKCNPARAVTVASLKEPRTCSYVLEFESDMVCKLLSFVDEFGMFEIPIN